MNLTFLLLIPRLLSYNGKHVVRCSRDKQIATGRSCNGMVVECTEDEDREMPLTPQCLE